MTNHPNILTDADRARMQIETRTHNEKLEKERKDRLTNSLTAKKICDKAKDLGSWIYDPKEKRWYTPEEFLKLYELYDRDHPLFYHVKIKHPSEGLNAGYKQLEILQNRLKSFSQKIIDYYQRNK